MKLPYRPRAYFSFSRDLNLTNDRKNYFCIHNMPTSGQLCEGIGFNSQICFTTAPRIVKLKMYMPCTAWPHALTNNINPTSNYKNQKGIKHYTLLLLLNCIIT